MTRYLCLLIFPQTHSPKWLYSLPLQIIDSDEQISTTYPLYIIALIFLGYSHPGAENSNDYDSCCCQLRKKRESHPLFITQHLVAAMHSGLFSDTVSGEIGIWSSSPMDFSLCDC